MDPHIFADPDPGSPNLVDPKDPDPDPKHGRKQRNGGSHEIESTVPLLFL